MKAELTHLTSVCPMGHTWTDQFLVNDRGLSVGFTKDAEKCPQCETHRKRFDPIIQEDLHGARLKGLD